MAHIARRERVFFGEDDAALDRDLLASHLVFVLDREGAIGRAAPERPLFGVLRPYRDRPGTRASGRFDPFAAPSANTRFLRTPDGRSRRESVISDRDGGPRSWGKAAGGDETYAPIVSADPSLEISTSKFRTRKCNFRVKDSGSRTP